MSDTTGRVNWEKPRRQIRISIEKAKDEGGPLKARDVWVPLKKNVDLRNAFLRSEITSLLKTFAHMIETAADKGMDGVGKEFDVEADSAFSTLQRTIRHSAAERHNTEYSDAAARAFQLGTTAWAGKLLHKTDPTKFKINPLVEAIRSDTAAALTTAAELILREYGERLLRSAVPGGTTDNTDVRAVLKDYRQQFRSFMEQNPDAEAWGSATLVATLQKYFKQLAE